MAKIAVDVVLLASEEMADKAVAANKELLKQSADKIVLNKENCLTHITIGYGEINNFSFPIKFDVSKLALCHLGNHCTCRNILASANLKKS